MPNVILLITFLKSLTSPTPAVNAADGSDHEVNELLKVILTAVHFISLLFWYTTAR